MLQLGVIDEQKNATAGCGNTNDAPGFKEYAEWLMQLYLASRFCCAPRMYYSSPKIQYNRDNNPMVGSGLRRVA